jgi:two-component system, response regulator
MRVMKQRNKVHVLVAEDDADDRMLIEKAFQDASSYGHLMCVENGVELIKYLKRDSPYDNCEKYPAPQIVLLDLNMPKKDGRQTLKEIKEDKELCKIPVIVFTTSRQQEDIENMYRLGTNSYIAKPSSFEELMSVAREIESYWFNTVQLPA